jgi:post-segregation antitoxin (ccd killing protein)
MVGRMPRVQVYLPDALYDELKSRDLPASELLQVAVRAEIERQDALDAADQYLAELAAEVGQPTVRDRARAKRIVQRISDHHLTKAG